MLKRKTLKVGDVEVSIVMIPARQAFQLSKDVAQVAVQLIGALGKLGTKSLDLDLATIGPELGQSIAGIESSKLDALLAGLLAKSEAKVNGAWLPLLDVVDDVFTGRVMDLYLCLFEAVKINYPDFFDRLGQQKGQGQPAQPTP
jgi:hypothetical protein